MSNITINDFENICRTCLSREGLKPLYEKCSRSCLAEMLMSCTFVKFTEDDGLPVKICTNCIHEMEQAISFAKRCETTDTILRKCVKHFKTKLANNLSQSQTVEPIITAEEEIQTEIKPDLNLSHMHRRIEEVFIIDEFAYEVKQEEKVKIESEEYLGKVIQEEYMEQVKQEEELIIENECDETSADPAVESYEQDVDEDQDETYSENFGIPGSTISFQIKEGSSKEEDGFPPAKSKKKGVRLHACHVCGKMFSKLAHLKSHQYIHTGEKPNVCSVCSKVFSHHHSIKRHMRLHTGEKPFICTVCNKTFTQSTSLKYHIRTHTGDKPYLCEVCNKTFAQSTILKYHMRKHTGEKPYICEICSKGFTISRNLKLHMMTHSREKPYTCEVCSKAFNCRGNLKTHMRIHAKEKPYSCGVCSKNFNQSTCLE